MNKKIALAVTACVLFLGTMDGHAQAGLKKSDKAYDQWAYIESATIYEKVLKRGYSSRDLLEKLGNAYYFNGRYSEASKQYEQLFTEYGNDSLAPEYYYRYAQTLQHTGNTLESKRYYEAFVSKAGSSAQISKFRENESELREQIKQNSGRYDQLTNLAINTPFADYGSFVHDNKLYFTSARDTGSLSKKVHTWTNEAFTSLYKYPLNAAEHAKQKVTRIKDEVKSKLNESTAVLTKDGQTMYFTRNNILNNTRKYDSDKNTRLKIYRAQLKDGKWTHVEELPFNGDGFSTAHPVLSRDEKLLYFASDRPGGFGSSDLWRIAIHDNGTFGGPENLGPEINTEARETFPFLTENDELYFSSDGRVGLGGLDVYAVKSRLDGTFGNVQNVGEPINSPADDFAYYIDHQSNSGFFSSNRAGGKGNDDIYSFEENRALQLECIQNVIVTVIDAKTRNVISDAGLTLYDYMYNDQNSHSSYKEGTYTFDKVFDCGTSYRIKSEKAGYQTAETEVFLSNKTNTTHVTLVMQPEKKPVKQGDDLFKVLELNPIYFDLDKASIRTDAALELAKVLVVLEEYPEMTIDIRSHTDSRASHKYNDQLSDRRAKATREWLIKQGISASRLTAKGYGERQLINKCADGVKCSEEEHQENRRSEFIIVKM